MHASSAPSRAAIQRGVRGTGLGLAMVYGMIQRHSAELEIESTAGQGTTVRVNFLAHTSSVVSTDRSEPPTVFKLAELVS